MNTIALIIRVGLGDTWKKSNRMSHSEFAKYAILVCCVAAYVIWGTVIVSRVFRYLNSEPVLGEILVRRLLHMATLATWFILIFSGTVGAFTNLFLSRDLNFLFAQPVAESAVFYPKFLRSFVLSAWPVVVLVTPLFVALLGVQGATFGLYILMVPATLCFLATPISLGSLVALLAGRFLPAGKSRRQMLIGSVVIVGLAMGWSKIVGLSELAGEGAVEILDDALVSRAGEIWYLPSHWLLELIDAGLIMDWGKAAFFAALLASTVVITLLPIVWIVEETNIYYRGFTRAQESGTRNGSKWSARRRRLPAPALRPGAALAVKDILIFVRTPAQWFQFSLLVALVVVYLLAVRQKLEELQAPFWHNLAIIVNLALIGFVVATLSVRFLYPHLAQEGRSYWILAASPLNSGQVLRSKFLLGLALNLSVSQALIWFSPYFVRAGWPLVVLCALALVPLAVALTSLAYGLGGFFPGFRTEHAAEIASEMGGLLTLLLGILLVGATVVLVGLSLKLHLPDPIGWGFFSTLHAGSALAAVWVLGAAVTAGSLILGHRSLSRREF